MNNNPSSLWWCRIRYSFTTYHSLTHTKMETGCVFSYFNMQLVKQVKFCPRCFYKLNNSFFLIRTLFGVRGREKLLQRGQGRKSRGRALSLSGLHSLALLSGHRTGVTEDHHSQTRLVLIHVSTLGVWGQGLPAGLDRHWTWKCVTVARSYLLISRSIQAY